MKIKTVNTILYCRKFDEMVKFYRDTLKLPVSAEFSWFVEFRLSDCACLSVADESRASIKSTGGAGITITLKVDDITGVRRELIAAGLSPGSVSKHKWGAGIFYLTDPEGTRLEFWAED